MHNSGSIQCINLQKVTRLFNHLAVECMLYECMRVLKCIHMTLIKECCRVENGCMIICVCLHYVTGLLFDLLL